MLEEKDLNDIQTLIDSSVRESESRMIAYFEAAILPKFDLLADGHKLLLETLAPKTKVDELEEEVSFLKMVVQSMSRDIAELKKAQ